MAEPDKKQKDESAKEVAKALGDLSRATVAPPTTPREKRPVRKIVRLTKHYGNNFAGEVCGFAPEVADELIAQKAAEAYKA